jgi:hypothetical protein
VKVNKYFFRPGVGGGKEAATPGYSVPKETVTAHTGYPAGLEFT